MFVLCQQIAVEQDLDRFMRLITDLNNLLEGKEQRLMSTESATANKATRTKSGSVKPKPAQP